MIRLNIFNCLLNAKEKTMKTKLIIMSLLLACGTWLAGCEQKGSAERAGETIDQTMEATGERLKEAGQAVQEKAENAYAATKKNLEEASEDTQEATKQAFEKTRETIEEAGQALKEKTQ
ncbi:hypothetical protein Noc_0980 [Nitrosococcus oceani ATCC 19707]|uniref:Uncharacterized protein n=2 Tax=Nitrosococcus oceani TaxID=1229 RepID=Q3JCF6_NITOC|nr:hypothetical protein Noc_0980 [Nitrosococcus oceani ATCC 19707]